jgi:MYXO-CTERM domain-containing protein
MPGKGESHTIRALKNAAGLVAVVAARRGLRAGWKVVTGQEPPDAPDDKQVPVGEVFAWAMLFGAGITTARMIGGRCVSWVLLPRRQRGAAGQTDSQGDPPPQPESPGFGYLALVAALMWRRRR